MRRLLALAAFFLAAPLWAFDVSGQLYTLPQYTWNGKDSPFDFGTIPSGSAQNETDLELRLEHEGFRVVGRGGVLATEGGHTEDASVLSEALWEGKLAGLPVSLGKKIISWGVGFGWRPLDVIGRENRQRLYMDTPEGVWQASVSHFGATDALTLMFANPGRGQEDDVLEDESVAMNYYRLMGGVDLHLVARASRRNSAQAGAGFSYVAGEHLEWHGEALYEQRHERLGLRSPRNILFRRLDLCSAVSAWFRCMRQVGMEDVLEMKEEGRDAKALFGGTWTWANGIMFLGEAWFDGSAFSEKEWERFVRASEAARTLLEFFPSFRPQANMDILEGDPTLPQQNIMRTSLFFRLGQMSPAAWLNWAGEWLVNPEDNGWVGTVRLVHRGKTQNVGLLFRQLGGPRRSGFGSLPGESTGLVFWERPF